MTSRLGLYRLVQMPGGHELLSTNPHGLADKIIEAGRDALTPRRPNRIWRLSWRDVCCRPSRVTFEINRLAA